MLALFTPTELQNTWRPFWEAQATTASVMDLSGAPAFGERQPGAVTLGPGETGLPFVLAVAANGDPRVGDTTRRTFLIAGLTLAIGLMLAASYGLDRITRREMLLARQQNDFVAAVSHEFRTPLTSMRHLTDLLVSRNIKSDERKAHYYALLAGETERLHRLVESLLSFGRIDAGAYAWQLETIDVSTLVTSVADEFRRETAGRPVRVEIEPELPDIRADGEALARALGNLLENAGKYSGPEAPIEIDACVVTAS
jgi:signal transduction histidine kinase